MSHLSIERADFLTLAMVWFCRPFLTLISVQLFSLDEKSELLTELLDVVKKDEEDDNVKVKANLNS